MEEAAMEAYQENEAHVQALSESFGGLA